MGDERWVRREKGGGLDEWLGCSPSISSTIQEQLTVGDGR